MTRSLVLSLLAAGCAVPLDAPDAAADARRATVPGLVGTHHALDLASFQLVAEYPTALQPGPIADWTGDGHADVMFLETEDPLSGLHQPAAVQVLRGPDFVPVARIEGLPDGTTHWGWALLEADLEGDGTIDLVLTTTRQLWVFRGPLAGTLTAADADATWSLSPDGAAYPSLSDVAVLDVDADGSDDLVAAVATGPDATEVRVFPAPVGDLAAVTPSQVVPYAMSSIQSFDLDLDGLDELIGARSDGGKVYEVPGLTGPEWRPWALADYRQAGGALVASEDLTGDGLPDLVMGDPAQRTLHVLDGVGDARVYVPDAVHPQWGSTDLGVRLEAIGDMDGDGYADVLTSNRWEEAVLLYGPLTGPDRFEARLTGLERFESGGDLDGDGIVDLVGTLYRSWGPSTLVVIPGVGGVVVDDDGDGFDADADCDDAAPEIHPGAPEWCDGVDSDCDGVIDDDCVALALSEVGVGELVVTELMIDPTACADTAAEWIEVYNAGDLAVDLAGLQLRDESGTVGVIGTRLVVEAGAYAVLGTGSASGWCAASGAAPDGFYGRSPALNNTGDLVWLLDPAGRVLDTIPRLRAPSPGVAIALDLPVPDALLNDDPAAWVAASASLGFERGTPGGPNVTERRVADLMPGDVVITEFMADPTMGSDTSSEWVELVNTLAVPVDLQGLALRDLAGNTSTIGVPVEVPPGGYVVVARGSGASFGYAFAPAAFWGSAVSLNNDTDRLSILADGRVIDEIATWTAVRPGVARQLVGGPDAALNDQTWAWSDATLPLGDDLGTPGAPNDR